MTELAAGQVQVAVEAVACAEPELAALDAGAAGGGAPAPGGAVVGRVVSAGEEAAHLQGARVLVGPLQACGECDACRRGATFACPARLVLGESAAGGLAGEVLARARWAVPLDGGLDLPGALAALVPREAVDAHAMIARAGLGAGDRCLVVGGGPVATLARQVAAARGAHEGAPAAEAGGPLAAILWTGGDPTTLASALARPDPAVTLVMLARSGSSAALSGVEPERLDQLLAAGGTVAGVPGAHPDLVPEVAAMAVKGELDLAAAAAVWRPEGPPLAQAEELARRLRAALGAGRALVVDIGPGGR